MCKTFFGAVVLAASLGGVASANDQADAKAILDQAIKAHGGGAALGKIVGVSYKLKGTQYDQDKQLPVSVEFFYQGNDKERSVSFDENNKIEEVEVVSGKEGWVKQGDQSTDRLSEAQLKSRQETNLVNWATTTLVPFRAEGFRLSLLAETSVAGRTAAGILISQDKHDPLKLYFDKETHLLVMYRRKYRNAEAGTECDEECVYSDYRDVRQTKQPFKMDVSWDGAKVYDLRASDIKLYAKPLDEKLFFKP